MNYFLQEFQEKIIEFLCSIKALDDEDNRTALLDGFSLAGDIKRKSSLAGDIRVIVRMVSAWGKSTEKQFEEKYYLQILMERTRKHVRTSEWEPKLDALIAEFKTLTVPVGEPVEGFFVNRMDEINRITSPPAYYLVDAPAGYGKTRLLKELRQRFDLPGWSCAYVPIHKGTMMLSVAEALASELKVILSSNTSSPRYGERLGLAIKSNLDASKRKIMLLLDFEKEPEISVFKELIHKFIPDMHRVLAQNANSPFIFRVVIAGRHLATTEECDKASIPLTIVTLTLFDYAVVRDFMRDYAKKAVDFDWEVNEISAHLTYLTGGHPKCISRISEVYGDSDWEQDDLVQLDPTFRVPSIIRQEVKNVYDALPFNEEMREFVAKLSVFRYLDYALLKKLVSDYSFAQEPTSTLEDRLTKTYLFNRHGRWIKNDIIRRVLVVWLRYNTENFKCLCERAKHLCLEGVKRPREREPEIWVVEYLFQCLQASCEIVEDSEERTNMREAFWSESFPNIMQVYFGPDALEDDIKYAKKCLKNRIEEDWEFQFVLNYYLREHQYTEQPYQKLKLAIENFVPTVTSEFDA